MPTLRLFAGLREAAGTSRVELAGDTVAAVLDAAVDRFGPGFAAALERARVWLNGDEAERSAPVGSDDEIALLPPVSGGANVTTATSVSPAALVLLVAALAMVVTNRFGSEAWYAAAVVGVVTLWTVDLATVVVGRGHDLPLAAVMVAIAGSVVAVHTLGVAGLALALVLAVVAPLVWAVVAESSRLIPIVAPAALVSTWAVAAVGSLFLVRRRFDVEVVAVLLVAVIAGTVVGALVERLDTLPFGDPFSATALTTILATVVAAAIWSLDLSTFLFTGVVVALGMVGGRGLGTVLRLRRPSLVERAPGWLTAADGPVLAAGLYYPVVSILG